MTPPNEEEYWKGEINSDLRYVKLFPKNSEKKAHMKDVEGEFQVLAFYRYCLHWKFEENDNPSGKFFFELFQ